MAQAGSGSNSSSGAPDFGPLGIDNRQGTYESPTQDTVTFDGRVPWGTPPTPYSGPIQDAKVPLKATVKRANPALAARRRSLILGGAAILVLGIGALTAFVWPGYALPEALPTPTLTVMAPLPIPTIAPLPREGEQTSLVAALPDSVLAWVQAGISGNAVWQHESYAVEAWTITYSDGVTDSGNRITANVGQWANGDEAARFYRAQSSASSGVIINRGDVFVGEQVVGTYSLYDLGQGQGAVLWRNGTVVIEAVGPLDELSDFFTAYPL